MTTYYAACLQTIPARDMRPAVIDRAAWLRRYLVERADQSWTKAYREARQELKALEAK